MTRHAESRLLPHTAEQMFDLVADIEAYPRFLPWCAGARIRARTKLDDHECIDAELVISFKVFKERFRSHVALKDSKDRITIQYLHGPMSHMHSSWEFIPRATGCSVRFEIDYEFKSRALRALIAMVFAEAMQRVVRAFEARALQIYGPPPQTTDSGDKSP